MLRPCHAKTCHVVGAGIVAGRALPASRLLAAAPACISWDSKGGEGPSWHDLREGQRHVVPLLLHKNQPARPWQLAAAAVGASMSCRARLGYRPSRDAVPLFERAFLRYVARS
jgi:hypothetical protein